MGTNYYARIKPGEKEREALIKFINEDNHRAALGLSYRLYKCDNCLSNLIHLGKKSFGWKFLWNTNYQFRNRIFYRIDRKLNDFKRAREIIYYYELNKDSINEFLQRPDVVISDEYGDLISLDEFLKISMYDTTPGLYDLETYQRDHGQEKFYEGDRDKDFRDLEFLVQPGGEFYSDGLRFTTSDSFS